MSVATLTGGDDDGQAYRQIAQALKEVLVRPARLAPVSDAGSAARGEREGAGDADGEAGQAVPLGGGEDQGEGEPDSRETAVWHEGPVETSWSWSGSLPEPVTRSTHLYLSTGCYHGDHAYCQSGVRGDGKRKRAATCKFCDARCICSCHAGDAR